MTFKEGLNLFSLFQTSYSDIIELRYVLLRELHLQPSEFDKMNWWEIETFVELLSKDNEEKRRQQKEQEKAQGSSDMKSMKSDMSNMMSNSMKSLGNMTSGFKMPKL